MNNRKTDRRKVIGPGTIAMIVGIVAFGAYSIFSQPSPAAKASFLSDASGKVIRAEPRPVQAPPLWKPEPELLRRYQAQLGLSAAQAKTIERIVKEWSSSKAAFERQIANATKFLAERGSQRLSVTSAQANLASYSDLSREYGRRRESAWAESLAVLDSRQRAILSQVLVKK